jgi:excisionase family DNA binding protein
LRRCNYLGRPTPRARANGINPAFITGTEEFLMPSTVLSEAMPESGFEPRIGRSVSLDHAAELLGVSRRTIYNRIREGRLQTVRTLGGSQRVLLDSVNEVLAASRRGSF